MIETKGVWMIPATIVAAIVVGTIIRSYVDPTTIYIGVIVVLGLMLAASNGILRHDEKESE
jgi:hypothetical protein